MADKRIHGTTCKQVAAAFGTRHVTWHRTPADRILTALDPFAMYAREHFPSSQGAAGARRLWSGDGGSVTLGHVYMSSATVEAAGRRLNTDAVRALFPVLRSRPTRQIGRRQTAHLSELATAGALAELTQRDRQALLLKEEGLDYGEIAAVLEIEKNSVGTTLSRARRRLAESYEAFAAREKGGKHVAS